MLDFTDAEKQLIMSFLGNLSPDQLLTRFLTVIDGLVETSDPGIAIMKAAMAAKSAAIQVALDGLDAEKTAKQTSLTAQKAVIDGLITKLSGG